MRTDGGGPVENLLRKLLELLEYSPGLYDEMLEEIDRSSRSTMEFEELPIPLRGSQKIG